MLLIAHELLEQLFVADDAEWQYGTLRGQGVIEHPARLSTRTAPIYHSRHVLISETIYCLHSQSCTPSLQ